ncbi:hypothetical protein [Pedobacter caeni]|uniref:Uncharacterized protein n=1 Tax=Pedobacter caeni TaxID=288992 RepID=A0A1M5GX05_9SPHI|nr:hypothetical protein [Pedobacter caeni]SHG08218.1 hypothetical protein SAMN04488522_104404 [Pedobacter caeni]
MKGKYFIAKHDGTERVDSGIYFGLVFKKGTYRELLKPGIPKEPEYKMNFPDMNGTKYDMGAPIYFESKKIKLPVMLEALNETDWWEFYSRFDLFFSSNRFFRFEVIDLNRGFLLKYEGVDGYELLSPIKQSNGKVAATFSLQAEYNYQGFTGVSA